MRMSRVFGTLCALIPFLAGCAGVRPQVVNEEFKKLLESYEIAYRLKPGDQLAVRVVGNEGFSAEKVEVALDGSINTPLGHFVVAGKTLPEAQALIRSQQREWPESPPPIVVELVEKAPEIVWVGGEVYKPGLVTLKPGMSALQAILEAGGPKPTGKTASVILIRDAGEGRRYVREVDLDVLEEDLILLPRDVLYVPRTAIGEVQFFVDQYINRIIPFNPYGIAAAFAAGY